MDDAKVVELFLERDEAALRAVSESYGPKLLRLAGRILGDAQAAEECVNDAYLRAWNSIPPNEPRQYLFAYLARLVRQLAISRLRSDSALKRSAAVTELTSEMEECLPLGNDTANEAEARELMRLINAFLKALPDEKRAVFLRRYWYFDSVSDIAGRFGCRESRVKTMLFRTREKLKAYLEKEGYHV